MKCKEFRDLIFSCQDGMLAPVKNAEFAGHLRSCPACAEEFAALAKTGALLAEGAGDVPVPDWDRSWRRIAAAVAPRPRRRAAWDLFPRWALAAAGFLAFFILGIAFARLQLFPPGDSPAGTGDPAFAFTARDYFSLLQPVMAEYANAQDPGAAAPEDVQRVRRLLNDLYLLKMRAEGSRERGLQLLLGDIELVLLEMVHLDRSRPESVRRLGALIQEKGLPMKLRVFNPDNRKLTQI
ncbi:MAG: zf-HC2 domain-containing protein [Acidobacteria bacterium]|jgi:hypothetical protein|nr:zf-HC2 domain-containing protein [Acidobacteriota bacterium]